MLSSGFRHNCVIDTTGKIKCWGKDETLNRHVNHNKHGVKQVSTGFTHICIIKTDGRLECQGHNFANQCDYPDEFAQNITQVAAGSTHSCAINTAMQLRCWGQPKQLLEMDENFKDLGRYERVETGQQHSCVLLQPQPQQVNLDCWGSNVFGQLKVPQQLETVFTHISLGSQHSCGISDSIKLLCWGSDSFGQLGQSSAMRHLSIGVTLGDRHTCSLSLQGVINCWGTDMHGELDVPVQAIAAAQQQRMRAGARHTCFIFPVTRQLMCWGSNSYGEGKVPPEYSIGVKDVALGFAHTCIIQIVTDDEILKFKKIDKSLIKKRKGKGRQIGKNDLDQKERIRENHYEIYPMILYNNVSEFYKHKIVIQIMNQNQEKDNEISILNSPNQMYKISHNNSSVLNEPKAKANSESESVAYEPEDESLSDQHFEIRCWGWNHFNQVSDDNELNEVLVIANPTLLAAGYAHNCLVTQDNTVYCWGLNTQAQCDIPESNSAHSESTTQVAKSTHESEQESKPVILSLSLGLGHTCLLSKSNSVVCWGLNNLNQLNQNTSVNTQLISLESSFNLTCVLDVNSYLQCWGSSLQDISDVEQFSVGYGNMCIMRSDTFQCQGIHSHNLLLDDQLTQDSGVTVNAFAAGKNQVCILSTKGINCDGDSNQGQCKIPRELQ